MSRRLFIVQSVYDRVAKIQQELCAIHENYGAAKSKWSTQAEYAGFSRDRETISVTETEYDQIVAEYKNKIAHKQEELQEALDAFWLAIEDGL